MPPTPRPIRAAAPSTALPRGAVAHVGSAASASVASASAPTWFISLAPMMRTNGDSAKRSALARPGPSPKAAAANRYSAQAVKAVRTGFTSQVACSAAPTASSAGPPIGYIEYQRPARSSTPVMEKNSGCGSPAAKRRPARRTWA